MIKIWSELRAARAREQVADLATLVWLVFWGSIVWQLFQFLSSFAAAGRTIRDGRLVGLDLDPGRRPAADHRSRQGVYQLHGGSLSLSAAALVAQPGAMRPVTRLM